MLERHSRICCLLLVFLLCATAGAYAERVASITLCEDVEGSDFVPVNITTRFTADAPAIHAVVQLEDLTVTTRARGAFISLDAISTPNYEIDSTELTAKPGQATVHFSLSRPDRGWPPGNYRFNLYLNDRLAAVEKFSIAAAQVQQPKAKPPATRSIQPEPQAPVFPGPQATQAPRGVAGSYVLQAGSVTLTLVLQQDSSGNVTGTLSSTTGSHFTIEGMMEEGVAVGVCYGEEGALFFEANPEGNQLAFALIEPDANNMPDYSRARQMVFTRAGRGPGPERPAQSRQSPGPSPESRAGGSSGPPAARPGEVGDPNWGFKFSPPPGWKWQHDHTGAILGHDTIAGMIVVFPHLATGAQEVQQQMMEGLTDEQTQLFLTGRLQTLTNNAVAGEYGGTYQGQQVKARGIGTFSPYGGGAYILAITTPDMYGPQLSGAADSVARGMEFFRVEVSDLVRHFSGMWASATSSTLSNMTFAPDGTYSSSYEASYWGSDAETGFSDWDATGQERNQGRWTVRGNREQGVIVITFPDGNETVLEYQVHREKGQTYWNEYQFNGKLYSKHR